MKEKQSFNFGICDIVLYEWKLWRKSKLHENYTANVLCIAGTWTEVPLSKLSFPEEVIPSGKIKPGDRIKLKNSNTFSFVEMVTKDKIYLTKRNTKKSNELFMYTWDEFNRFRQKWERIIEWHPGISREAIKKYLKIFDVYLDGMDIPYIDPKTLKKNDIFYDKMWECTVLDIVWDTVYVRKINNSYNVPWILERLNFSDLNEITKNKINVFSRSHFEDILAERLGLYLID